MRTEHVQGEQKAQLMLYALSTCVWCGKTKEFLDQHGLAYDYVFVDQLDKPDRSQAMDQIARWNPACSFPTLVIDNASCIVGFKPDELKEKLGL